LNIQYSTTAKVPRYDRLSELRKGLPRYAEWYYGPQDRLLSAYNYSYQGNYRLLNQLQLIAAYQQIKESRHDRALNNNWLNNRFERVDVYSFLVDIEKRRNIHQFRYGIDMGYNRVNSTAFAQNAVSAARKAINTRYPSNGSQMASFSAYLSHRMNLSDKWIFEEGVRLNHVALTADFSDKTFFAFPYNQVKQINTAMTGSGSMVFLPYRNWKVAALLSSGFRAPNLDDLSKVFDSVKGDTSGTNSQIGTLILPNPDLKPEYTYNAEISIEKVWWQKVHLNITGYYTWYRQAITVQNSLFGGLSQIRYGDTLALVQENRNSSSANLYGTNVSLNLTFSSKWRARATYNYTYGRIITDSVNYPLDHIPPVYGQAALSFEPTDKFITELFIRYNGWKRVADYNLLGEDNYAQATPRGMPDWYTLNFRLAYSPTAKWYVQIGLENILNRNYRVFASGISAAGRNLTTSVRYTF